MKWSRSRSRSKSRSGGSAIVLVLFDGLVGSAVGWGGAAVPAGERDGERE
jgi:hypothetical protein